MLPDCERIFLPARMTFPSVLLKPTTEAASGKKNENRQKMEQKRNKTDV